MAIGGIVKKTIEQIGREKRRRRQVALALAIIFSTLLLGFGIAAINETLGKFTVNLRYQKRNLGISICDNREMKNLTTHLAADMAPNITNISYPWLPLQTVGDKPGIDDIDGAHNGRTIEDLNVTPEEYQKYVADDGSPKTLYLAYTFYIHNVYMTDGVNYTMSLDMVRKTRNADKAIRVLLIEDIYYYGHVDYGPNPSKADMNQAQEVVENKQNKRLSTIYGAAAESGGLEQCMPSGEKGDPDIAFNGETNIFIFDKAGSLNDKGEQVFNKDGSPVLDKDGKTIPCGLPQGQIHKYTIVIYFEGWDPECNFEIMGGSVKMELNIEAWNLETEKKLNSR